LWYAVALKGLISVLIRDIEWILEQFLKQRSC
jgi:hypothetical protein